MTLVGQHPTAAATARLLFFLAQAVLFGLLPVVLLALRPAFAPLPVNAPARRRVETRLQRTADLALVLAAVAAVLLLLLQAGVLAGVRGTALDTGALAAVLDTHVGRWQALRLPLLLALAVVLRGRLGQQALRGAGDGRPAPPVTFWWTWGALAVALLATVSLSGHAVTLRPGPVYVLNDLVHLTAGAAWLAGVAVLTAVLPSAWVGLRVQEQAALLARAVVPFSRVAQVAIPLVGLTGIVATLADVGRFADLRTTGYGQALVVKLWLFAWVLAFGGYNHFWLIRRLDPTKGDRTGGVQRTLVITVTGELALGLLVLGATAVLTGLPRPR